MGTTTATPYFLPYPVQADTPDVPRDIQALADKVHLQLNGLSDRIDGVKTTADTNTKSIAALNTALKAPTYTDKAANIIKNNSGFTVSYARLWRWGNLVAVDVRFSSTIKRSDPDGNINDVRMGTWTTKDKPVAGAFPITTMVDGLMATGYIDTTGMVLTTLEAGGIWAAKGLIRFGGWYFTTTTRGF